jgi:hypothetical protein
MFFIAPLSSPDIASRLVILHYGLNLLHRGPASDRLPLPAADPLAA